jgi:hypothetical protein
MSDEVAVEFVVPGALVEIKQVQPEPRRKIDTGSTTREFASFTLFADGAGTQEWVIKDQAGLVIGRDVLAFTAAEVTAMLDDPAEKVKGSDGTRRTPLRHLRREITELRRTNRARIVRMDITPDVDLID